jgi:hypothetical protein
MVVTHRCSMTSRRHIHMRCAIARVVRPCVWLHGRCFSLAMWSILRLKISLGFVSDERKTSCTRLEDGVIEDDDFLPAEQSPGETEQLPLPPCRSNERFLSASGRSPQHIILCMSEMGGNYTDISSRNLRRLSSQRTVKSRGRSSASPLRQSSPAEATPRTLESGQWLH